MAKRVRDYAREELQRNLKWQSFGFTSRAQARRARERGELPPESEIRENTEYAVEKLAALRTKLESPEQRAKIARSKARGLEQRPTKVTFTEAKPPAAGKTPGKRGRTYKDEQSHQWSLAHSRQDRSKYSDRMTREQRDAYYDAYVDGWDLPHDERDLGALYDYLIEYWEFAPEPDAPDWAGYGRKH